MHDADYSDVLRVIVCIQGAGGRSRAEPGLMRGRTRLFEAGREQKSGRLRNDHARGWDTDEQLRSVASASFTE